MLNLDILRKLKFKLFLLRDKVKYGKMDRRQTFEYIYINKKWDKTGGKAEFYSGPGSHEDKYVEPYCRMIRQFILQHNITEVCDIGCGDFNVASKWLNDSIQYKGVDIVQRMIDHHNREYANEHISFQCLDIVEENLPDAQLCLVRQVLQHLNNDEVMCVLRKIKKYKYVIITESVTEKQYAKEYNSDKSHGSGIRVYNQSGLYFDEEPFNLKVQTLLEIPCDGERKHEMLVSVLVEN